MEICSKGPPRPGNNITSDLGDNGPKPFSLSDPRYYKAYVMHSPLPGVKVWGQVQFFANQMLVNSQDIVQKPLRRVPKTKLQCEY